MQESPGGGVVVVVVGAGVVVVVVVVVVVGMVGGGGVVVVVVVGIVGASGVEVGGGEPPGSPSVAKGAWTTCKKNLIFFPNISAVQSHSFLVLRERERERVWKRGLYLNILKIGESVDNGSIFTFPTSITKLFLQ